ncbi:MAG: DUF2442 domain-containing protein [Phycisphaerales bacterium]|nr:DUF2442 domain-containing protein [Phycisphaerales bacterium]
MIRWLRRSQQERFAVRSAHDRIGLHWPDVDEDLSVAGLLRGAAAPGAARKAV